MIKPFKYSYKTFWGTEEKGTYFKVTVEQMRNCEENIGKYIIGELWTFTNIILFGVTRKHAILLGQYMRVWYIWHIRKFLL